MLGDADGQCPMDADGQCPMDDDEPHSVLRLSTGTYPQYLQPDPWVFTDHVTFQIPGIYLSAGTHDPWVKP